MITIKISSRKSANRFACNEFNLSLMYFSAGKIPGKILETVRPCKIKDTNDEEGFNLAPHLGRRLTEFKNEDFFIGDVDSKKIKLK